MVKILTVIVGRLASGKTTLAKQLRVIGSPACIIDEGLTLSGKVPDISKSVQSFDRIIITGVTDEVPLYDEIKSELRKTGHRIIEHRIRISRIE